MNLQRPHLPIPQIQQLKDLFTISLEICRERALELFPANPRNLALLQILAACQFLFESYKNYNKSIELYQTCLEIDPDNIAFYNNLARNFIELEDYHMAATFLNDIKQKWNHPAIYYNLALTYERGKVKDPKLLDEAVQKMELYRKNNPDFQSQNYKGLIHTFLLNADQRYNLKEIKEFETEVLQSVIVFQNMLHIQLDMERIDKVLQRLHQKIVQKIEQQEKYGIRIQNPIKAIIQVLQAFRAKLIPCYKKEWKKQINEYFIEAIRIVNTNIFEGKIDKDSQYGTIYENQVQPCLIQLEVTANDILVEIVNLQNKKQALVNKPLPQPNPPIVNPVSQLEDQELKKLQQKDQEIRKDEKDKIPGFEREGFPSHEYNFYSRLDDIEEILLKHQHLIYESLKIKGQSIANPLFLIVRFKEHNNDSYYVYYNRNRINLQLLKAPQIPNLQHLQKHGERAQIIKYYHVLNLVLKFYNFYGSHNFQYKLKNDFVASIELNHFVSLITPVLNQFFDGEQIFANTKFGWLFNQIHFAISQHFRYTSESHLKTFKILLKRINQIQESPESTVQNLMNDILKQNHSIYIQHLLNHQLTELYGSTKQHSYFNWKINRYHLLHRNKLIRSAFKEEDNWIISNVAFFLITLAQKPLSEDKGLLAEAFTDCFYKPNQSYKQEIIKNFYASNHNIPLMEKVATSVKKIVKILSPFQ